MHRSSYTIFPFMQLCVVWIMDCFACSCVYMHMKTTWGYYNLTKQIKSIQTAHKLELEDAQCRGAQKSYCSKKSEGEEKREEKK